MRKDYRKKKDTHTYVHYAQKPKTTQKTSAHAAVKAERQPNSTMVSISRRRYAFAASCLAAVIALSEAFTSTSHGKNGF
jgi:hypothetical protein